MKLNSRKCCGCALCAAICPAGAITMRPDAGGFLHPEINTASCVNCDLCVKKCPVNTTPDGSEEILAHQHCYYAISADETLTARASSGGMFPELAGAFLRQDGAVAGAVFDENFDVKLELITDLAELPRLLQAKYVQATFPPELFARCKELLDNGKALLFSGTPCQIAAFKHFLNGRNYEKLLCVEVICNSVPAPAVWRSYLEFVSGKTGAPVTAAAFRDKVLGWHKASLTIECGKEKISQMHKESPYMQLFLQGLISRPSCSECRFKNGRSGADISLGDFWKLHKIAPELNNNTGVSMVITHTEAGENALKKSACRTLRNFPMKTVKLANRRFFEPLRHNPRRDDYFAAFAANNGRWFDPAEYITPPREPGLFQKIMAWFKH